MASFAAIRPEPVPTAPATAIGVPRVASLSKYTTPMPSSSPNRSTNTGALSLSTSIRNRPSPASQAILPDLSNTKTVATVGLGIVVADKLMSHVCPVCTQVTSAVSGPELPTLVAVYENQTCATLVLSLLTTTLSPSGVPNPVPVGPDVIVKISSLQKLLSGLGGLILKVAARTAVLPTGMALNTNVVLSGVTMGGVSVSYE